MSSQPRSKEAEEERRKGAVPLPGGGARPAGLLERWFGLGARSSPIGARAASAVRLERVSAARGGGAALLARLFANPLGAALGASALIGTAVFVCNHGLGGGVQPEERAEVFPVYGSATPSAAPRARAADGPNSLDFLREANASKDEAASGGSEKGAESALAGAGAEAAQATAEAAGAGGAEAGQDAAAGQAQVASGEAPGREKAGLLAGALAGAKGLSAGNQLSGGSGLSGGAGLSGGFSRAFDKPSALGKPTALVKGLQPRPVPASSMQAARSKGVMSQLRFTSGQSRRATGAGSAEGQAFQASTAFEAASPAAGGAAIPEGGPSSGGSEQLGVLGAGDGGPIVLDDQTVEEVPDIGASKDRTRYNKLVNVAVALLMTASTIIIIEGIIAQFGILKPIAVMLQGLAAAMAASAALMGTMIANSHGQEQQGMILTVGGGITTAAAIAAMASPPGVAPIMSVIGGTAGLLSSIMAAVWKDQV